MDIEDCSTRNDAGTPDTHYRQAESRNSLGAPTAHNTSKKGLFGIIGDVRAKTIQNVSVVAVGTSYKLLRCHPRLERLHDECKGFVE